MLRTGIAIIVLCGVLVVPAKANVRVLVITPLALSQAAEALVDNRAESESVADHCYGSPVFTTVTTEEIDDDPDFMTDPNHLVPQEIRNCIDYYAALAPPFLTSVILLGDETLVPTYRASDAAGVPYSWDDWYVSTDGIPGYALGRIPAASLPQALALVGKIATHDAGNWRLRDVYDWRHDVMACVGDRAYPNYVDPASVVTFMAEIFNQELGGMSECGDSDAYGLDTEESVVEWVNDQLSLGRGVWLSLGTNNDETEVVGFVDTDAGFRGADLDPITEYPILVANSCNAARYQGTGLGVPVIPELLFSQGRGIIGAIAPTGPTSQLTNVLIMRELLRELRAAPICGANQVTVAEAVRRVKVRLLTSGQGAVHTIRMYRYEGDPTMKLPMRDNQVTITEVDSELHGYEGEPIRMTVHFTDPSLPSNQQGAYHTYYWTADKGTINGSGSQTAYYRCDENCYEPANITVSVTEGGVRPPFACNGDAKTVQFTFDLPPESGGCPVLDVKSQGQWKQSNSLFTRCAYDSSARVVDDSYWIPENPIAQLPVIDLKISETVENEITDIDYTGLRIVDHAVGTAVWVDDEGVIWEAQRTVAPSVCTIYHGPDVSEDLGAAGDSLTLTVARGDTVFVVFADTTWTESTGLLRVVAQNKMNLAETYSTSPDEAGLRLLPGLGVGDDQVILPRKNMGRCVPADVQITRGDGVPDTVGLVAWEYHVLDQISLAEGVEEWSGSVFTPGLLLATHSDSGDVKARLLSKDGVSSRCSYGQSITVRFWYPELQAGYQREIVFDAKGGYSINEIGLRQTVPASVPWGVSSVHPNPFTRDVRIEYAIAGNAPATIEVFDVGGRRVRQIPGDGPANQPQMRSWDGVDNDGRQLPAGVYFLRLQEGKRTDARKLVILR